MSQNQANEKVLVLDFGAQYAQLIARRVREAAKQLGYSVNYAASALRSDVTKTIGLVIPSATEPFSAQLLDEIEPTIDTESQQLLLGIGATQEAQAERIESLANRHVENPETVVKPGEEVFVKVIDVDLDRRRISLSLKQANDSVDPASEDFDPALYGMPAEYDEQGNYKYPEGFDPATNEWIAGYEKQREEWESQYATAHDLWEQHKEFVAKELENAEASAAEDGQAPKEEKVEEVSNYSSDNTSNGTLADSDQLAALRDQLLGK